MTAKLPPPPPPPPAPARWQFSLAWLVLAMTVAAAIAGVVRVFEASLFVRVVLIVYLMFFTGYALLRLPFIVGPMLKNSRQRRAIDEHRKQLAQWARQVREEGPPEDDESA